MIVMVCVSVIATVLVIHLSAISQPVPPWVNTLFLRIIPRLMLLSVEPGENTNTGAPAVVWANHGSNESADDKSHVKHIEATTNGMVMNQKMIPDANHAPQQNPGKELQSMACALNFLKADTERKNADSLEAAQWRRVSIIVDRLLLYIFSTFGVVCTIYMTTEIVFGSNNDYDSQLKEFEREW